MILIKISIGVITYKRINDLIHCVQSIENSINFAINEGKELKINKLIISDDGDAITEEFIKKYFSLRWERIAGPKRGIGANRNNILKNVEGDWFLMVDDDMEIPRDFILNSLELLERINSKKTIITGPALQNGKIIPPTQPNYWGHRCIKIDCIDHPEGFLDQISWYPISIVSMCKFDESVIYGATEMDFAHQLISKGFDIKYDEKLLVVDLGVGKTINPSNVIDFEAARIFYMFRRYGKWKKSMFKLMIFGCLEPIRLSVALFKVYKIIGIQYAIKSYVKSYSFLKNGRKGTLY